jgi:hypothetical protein
MKKVLPTYLIFSFSCAFIFGQNDTNQINSLRDKLKSKDIKVKIKALDEIGSLGKQASALAYDICNLLLDKSAIIQQQAATTLEKVRPDLHKPIVEFWFDDSINIKRDALEKFRKMGTDASPFYHVLHTVTVARIKSLSSQGSISIDWFIKEELLTMQSIQPEKEDVRNITFQVASRANKDSFSRLWAIKSLANEGQTNKELTTKVVSVIIDSLNDEITMASCIEILGTFGSKAEAALPSLGKFNLHPDNYIRELASKSIDNIKNNRVIDLKKPDAVDNKPSEVPQKNEVNAASLANSKDPKASKDRNIYINTTYKTKFYKIDDDLWFEIEIESKLPRFTWQEKSRTTDYIEIHNLKNGEKLRLFSKNTIWWNKKQEWEGHSAGYFEK